MQQEGGAQLAQQFRELLNLGSACMALLDSLGRGEVGEQFVEVAGRTYRVSAKMRPVKIEIEPMDN